MADEIHGLDDEAPATAETAAAVSNERRRDNGDGSITLELKYPVQVKYRRDNQERDELVTELRMRRANGGDLRQVIRFQNDEEKVVVLLFVRLTGYPEEVLNKMDAEDVLLFFAEVQDFLPQSPSTGKKS